MMWRSLLSISASLLYTIINFFKKNSKHLNGVNQIIWNIILLYLLKKNVSTFWWFCDLNG